MLPFDSSNGCYRNPLLIDKTLGGMRSILLQEVLVAGSAAVDGSGTLWNAGDLLGAGHGDSRHSQVLVYARTNIYGADGGIGGATDPRLPLTSPTSIAVTPRQFPRRNSALSSSRSAWIYGPAIRCEAPAWAC